MSAATPITWTQHTADELHELAKHCGDAKQASRARAIAMIMEGASRTAAARAQGMELQILRDWCCATTGRASRALRIVRAAGARAG